MRDQLPDAYFSRFSSLELLRLRKSHAPHAALVVSCRSHADWGERAQQPHACGASAPLVTIDVQSKPVPTKSRLSRARRLERRRRSWTPRRSHTRSVSWLGLGLGLGLGVRVRGANRVRLADEVRAREELRRVHEPAQRLLAQVVLALALLREEGEVTLLGMLSPQRLLADASQLLRAEREAVLEYRPVLGARRSARVGSTQPAADVLSLGLLRWDAYDPKRQQRPLTLRLAALARSRHRLRLPGQVWNRNDEDQQGDRHSRVSVKRGDASLRHTAQYQYD
eukprot:scaffold68018_cov68-Phaeocystis_antarctica.AAC.2